MTIENVTDDIGVLSIVGPNSKHVLTKSLQQNIDGWKFLDAKKVHIQEHISMRLKLYIIGEFVSTFTRIFNFLVYYCGS